MAFGPKPIISYPIQVCVYRRDCRDLVSSTRGCSSQTILEPRALGVSNSSGRRSAKAVLLSTARIEQPGSSLGKRPRPDYLLSHLFYHTKDNLCQNLCFPWLTWCLPCNLLLFNLTYHITICMVHGLTAENHFPHLYLITKIVETLTAHQENGEAPRPSRSTGLERPAVLADHQPRPFFTVLPDLSNLAAAWLDVGTDFDDAGTWTWRTNDDYQTFATIYNDQWDVTFDRTNQLAPS